MYFAGITKCCVADSVSQNKTDPIVSIKSVHVDAKKEVEEEEEGEDLPEFSFMDILKWNKPEIFYILSERFVSYCCGL